MKIDATVLMTSLPLKVAAPTPDVVVLDDRATAARAAAAPGLAGMPPELRDWLVRLRLMDGVPFAYLVADTALLPEESIRWFYVDRRWTDALVQGALSVGTVNSDDRTQLTAEYPAIRDALDRAERNQRRRTTVPWLEGEAGPVSGFLLRSRAVSGWPALHVRAFNVDPAAGDEARYPEGAPERMRLLRLERLAPAVLLVLFDGIPTVVHVEEPRQGVQFGFDPRTVNGQQRPTLRPRNATTFEYLSGPAGAPIDVPFRPGTSGVVDIQQLEALLADRDGTGAGDEEGLTSAEYALQLVRFPFRQVFGDTSTTTVPIVFRPTVSYETMVRLFRAGAQP